jgi:hypothetical protein
MDEFTGYVPKIGDRVRVSALDYEGKPNHFSEKVGTVCAVAPNLTNCRVWVDDLGDGNNYGGYSGVRLFPGEIEKIEG